MEKHQLRVESDKSRFDHQISTSRGPPDWREGQIRDVNAVGRDVHASPQEFHESANTHAFLCQQESRCDRPTSTKIPD